LSRNLRRKCRIFWTIFAQKNIVFALQVFCVLNVFDGCEGGRSTLPVVDFFRAEIPLV
jgi:hypothetical protein